MTQVAKNIEITMLREEVYVFFVSYYIVTYSRICALFSSCHHEA